MVRQAGLRRRRSPTSVTSGASVERSAGAQFAAAADVGSAAAGLPAGYLPLFPFTSLADAQAWEASYQSGGHQPWHRNADMTATAFAASLGYTGLDRVADQAINGDEARVGVGYALPNGKIATAAVVHLLRFGTGKYAPWEVVGTDDTTFSLDTPAYGSPASSPVTVGGAITGVDENIRVQVHGPGSSAPVGTYCCRRRGAQVTVVGDSDVPRRARPGAHDRGVDRRACRRGRAVRGHRRAGRIGPYPERLPRGAPLTAQARGSPPGRPPERLRVAPRSAQRAAPGADRWQSWQSSAAEDRAKQPVLAALPQRADLGETRRPQGPDVGAEQDRLRSVVVDAAAAARPLRDGIGQRRVGEHRIPPALPGLGRARPGKRRCSSRSRIARSRRASVGESVSSTLR